jgi:divalent metal cation (Fe/Co/Zn/Cd) transporter
VGLLITVAILAVLRTAVRDVCRRLMDAVEPEHVDVVGRALRAAPGVLEVPGLRLRWSGHRMRGEAELVVPDHLSVREARAICGHAVARAREAVPSLDHLAVELVRGPVDRGEDRPAAAPV